MRADPSVFTGPSCNSPALAHSQIAVLHVHICPRQPQRLAATESERQGHRVEGVEPMRVLEKNGFSLTGYDPDGQAVYQREVR